MKLLLLLLSISLSLNFVGCVFPQEYVTTSMMEPELQYRGFVIKRPSDSRWVSKRSEQLPIQASLSIPLDSPTHTFYALVTHERLPEGKESKKEFKEYVDQQNTTLGPRHEMISYESKFTEKQGLPCVEYRAKVLDKAPLNSSIPLVMTMTGFIVIHPSFENTMIDAHYSERGTEKEVDGTLDTVGKSLLSGIYFETLEEYLEKIRSRSKVENAYKTYSEQGGI